MAVGSAVGVVFNAADVVPSPADSFRGVPTSLAAVVGINGVEGADVLGAANLRERLQHAYSDPAAGVEARNTGTELDRWQAAATRSYAWQVSTILVDFMQRARGEVAGLVSQIQSMSDRAGIDERLRERQAAISTILKTFTVALFVVLLVLVGIAALDWVGWVFALSTAGALIVLYVVVSLALFLLSQRDLFAEMNLRRSQQNQLETMQANLRTALQDLSRLTSAYGQLLAWCRTLGTVLRAPFGAPPPSRPAVGQLADGLPRSTQIGIATPSSDQADNATHGIQRRLYSLGWLTKPWEDMLAEAASRLREEPIALFRQPGVGTSSGLRLRSCQSALAVSATTANAESVRPNTVPCTVLATTEVTEPITARQPCGRRTAQRGAHELEEHLERGAIPMFSVGCASAGNRGPRNTSRCLVHNARAIDCVAVGTSSM
ncbi:hypothetical protein [Mycolicibacterium mageritense]|uniref:hypothetical protein n=1 Tax=Mycolicibacterium mageritense TaxID=53462 RepID=UPI001E5C9BDF|nr:hypothetical protein [Mycolicibacterium mageritense]MCC9187048.1 hypothetical protein [Mycolicibacterium mageritense]